MKKIIYLYIVFGLFIQTSCHTQNQKMSEKTNFPYRVSVTAPREYPIEVHVGYLSTQQDFITPVPKAGVEDNGWQSEGADAGLGASQIPSFLELSWVSYAEKKFWKIATPLPADTILAYFRKGYKISWTNVIRSFTEEEKKAGLVQDTYDQIVIGVAPGGVVVVWLQGAHHRVEIGRYQAKDTVVDKNKFEPVPDVHETQEEFYNWNYNHFVPQETQEKIKKGGIPFGLWDEYRKKYNWRFHTAFYNPDKEKDMLQYLH